MYSDSIRAAERLARAQFGVLTTGQAHGCGVSPYRQRELRRNGRWREHIGCLAPGRSGGGDLMDASALQLRLGPESLTTGPTAMRILGWQVPDRLLIAAAPAATRRGGRDALVLVDDIAREVSEYRGLRLAGPADALLDTMVCVGEARARELVDLALQQHWLAAEDFPGLIEPRVGRGRRGAALLRAICDTAVLDAHSEAERRMVPILRRTGEPWHLNWVLRNAAGVPFRELDAALPELMLCVEIDGRAAHSSHDAFEHDRARQNELQIDGWLVLRFTWHQIVHQPEWVLEQLLRAIERRRLEFSAKSEV